MAQIITDNDFREAVRVLVEGGQLPVAGQRFVNASERAVYDEQPGNLVNITPDTATLEAALDDANIEAVIEAQVDAVQDGAKAQASTIPAWATFTEAQALAYIDANVNDLASAIVVLKALTRMVIALRNQQWPDLQTT